MSWPSKTDAIEHIVVCLETVGTREFFDPFFKIIHEVLSVDQCMIFMLAKFRIYKVWQ